MFFFVQFACMWKERKKKDFFRSSLAQHSIARAWIRPKDLLSLSVRLLNRVSIYQSIRNFQDSDC